MFLRFKFEQNWFPIPQIRVRLCFQNDRKVTAFSLFVSWTKKLNRKIYTCTHQKLAEQREFPCVIHYTMNKLFRPSYHLGLRILWKNYWNIYKLQSNRINKWLNISLFPITSTMHSTLAKELFSFRKLPGYFLILTLAFCVLQKPQQSWSFPKSLSLLLEKTKYNNKCKK